MCVYSYASHRKGTLISRESWSIISYEISYSQKNLYLVSYFGLFTKT